MNYCENCFYYTPDIEGHVCQCPKMIYGYYGVKSAKDGMLVEDDEGWGFVPGPEFGCIHCKEKE